MRPITEVLIEFSRGSAPPFLIEPLDQAPSQAESEAEAMEQALAEVRQQAMEEGRTVAERAAAAEIAALHESHAADVAQMRAQWAATEGAVLAEALATGLAAMETAIARSLAMVLLPVLDAALRKKAAGEMAAAVGQLLAGSQGPMIEVRGAADLVQPVRDAFAGNPAVAVTDAEGAEIVMTAGDTVVASQIETWSARLHAALESTP